MKDLLLGKCGDVKISEGDFLLAAGADQVRQNWLIRVRTFLGEWLLDKALGVPYFQEIFSKTMTENRLQEIFYDLTAATPGVLRVDGVAVEALDARARTIGVTVEALIEGPEGPERTRFIYDGSLLPGDCAVVPASDYPLRLGDLTIWFDAQDAEATTQQLAAPVVMLNKAGTGSAVGALATLLGSSSINGHRAVQLANDPSADAFLSIADTPAVFADGFTAFVVARHKLFAGYGALKGQALFALHGVDPALAQQQSLNFTYIIVNGTGSKLSIASRQQPSTVQEVLTTEAPTVGIPEIYVARVLPVSTDMARNINWQESTGAVNQRFLDGDGLLGATYDTAFAPATFFNGDIGELLVYKGELNDTQVNALVLWLRAKWSMTFALQPGFGHGPFGHGPFGGGV